MSEGETSVSITYHQPKGVDRGYFNLRFRGTRSDTPRVYSPEQVRTIIQHVKPNFIEATPLARDQLGETYEILVDSRSRA